MQGLDGRGGVGIAGGGEVIQSYHGIGTGRGCGGCSEEGFPCCRADNAVDGELVRGLVCLDRVGGVGTKSAVDRERLAVLALVTEGVEESLQGLDGCGGVGIAGGSEVCELCRAGRTARGNGSGGVA